MPLFDAHTHLNHELLFPNRKEHLHAFEQRGGKGIVNIGANPDYNRNGILIAQASKQHFPQLRCKASIGIHPCDVNNPTLGNVASEILNLKTLQEQHPEEIVAIGECGIDLFYPWTPETLELQQEYFLAQCQLAEQLNLPIVIHSRSAFEETIEILQAFKSLKIYFHCRSYSEKEIEVLLSLFPQIWIGFTGILTYPKSESIRKSLIATPLQQILLETDAPYLAPQKFRGQTNTPQYVEHIWTFAAEVLGLNTEALWQQVGTNMHNLYTQNSSTQSD